MKKSYISPSMDVVVLNAEPLMLSTSETEVGGDEIDSNKFQGLLWEDDDNEAE